MLNRAFFKRIIPFLLTFALGLFIASFFVSITPNLQFKRGCCGRRNDMRQLKYENERLRLENQRLQEKLDSTDKMILLEAPVPPPAPSVRVIEMPMDTVPAAPRAK